MGSPQPHPGRRDPLQATDATEKARSLLALSYASSASDVARTLDYALRAEVKSQDVRTLIVATAARSSTNLQLAWAFLRTCAPHARQSACMQRS